MGSSPAVAQALTATTATTTRSATAAILNGTVKPEGVPLNSAGCFFEWGETESYGHIAPCEHPDAKEINNGAGGGLESQITVHARLTGLTLGVKYHSRLLTANTTETAEGSDQAFSAGSDHTFSTSFPGPAAVPLTDPLDVAVDQQSGDIYVSNGPSNQTQTVTLSATGGTFTLTFAGRTTAPISYHAPAKESEGLGSLEAALSSLEGIHSFQPGVSVSGNPGGPYAVEFTNSLGGAEQPPLIADAAGLTGPAPSATTAIASDGGRGAEVEKLTASGQFLFVIGADVNQTTGADLCTAAEACQPATTATTPGAFLGRVNPETGASEKALWLALDNSPGGEGDLYVGDPGDALISKFDSSGHLITGWGSAGRLDGSGRGGPFFPGVGHGLAGIAVDPTDGALFAVAISKTVYEYNQDGSWLAGGLGGEFAFPSTAGLAADAGSLYYLAGNALAAYSPLLPGTFKLGLQAHSVLPPSGDTGIAFDPATRDLYLDTGASIAHYPASCAASGEFCSAPPLDEFGVGNLNGSLGLAVDSSTGAAYVADSKNHRLDVFDSVPYLPQPTPTAAVPKGPSEELLQAQVAPAQAGKIIGCHFEYVPAAAFAANVQTITLTAATATGNLTRGSDKILALKPSSGTLAPGEPIEAEGIPFGTKIVSLDIAAGTVELSAPATLSGLAVPLRAKPDGGTFTLNGSHPFAYNTNAEAFWSQNQPIAGPFATERIGGSVGGPYRVEFGSKTPLATADAAGLSPPGSTIEITSNGAGGGWLEGGSAAEDCSPPLPYPEAEPTDVTALTTGLTPGTAYDFRIAAANANGSSASYSQEFTTLPQAPTIGATTADEVFPETAQINAQIDPGGGETAYHTSYHVEYITERNYQEDGAAFAAGTENSPSLDAGSAHTAQRLTAALQGLQPDTTYDYRVVASNECETEKLCTTHGAAHAFITLPPGIAPQDPCPNAHVRQQTSADQLLDCRAYEFVSAAHTAGYDVESNLVSGQSPFAGYPAAQAATGQPRVLYGIHDGGIPDIGDPTNHGIDPYVATRTETGWSTEYVGIPAHGIPSTVPFGSPLVAADSSLETFAFGGSGLCSPCFGIGIETGIPLHLPGREALVQGMAGPTEPGPAATSDGYIAQPLSADGEHLIFGSTSAFAEGANNNTGNVSLYDRNLVSGETHVVSKGPSGENLHCLQGTGNCHSPGDQNGISELAVSTTGSHILIAQRVSTDADGDVYWRLYMNLGDSEESIELAPKSATHGVLFDGMTEDGSKVFFTSADKLLPADTDSSPDIYMWSQQGEEEGEPLSLISTGESGPSNSDACNPVNSVPGAGEGQHWNSIGPVANCGAVAIGGGGGVASGNGSIFFLSPELLAGTGEPQDGIKNAPNLYLAAPGQAPRFIATLEPSNPLVLDAVEEAGTRHSADFQVTPNGRFAAFPSTLALAGRGEETAGHTVLYRYDASSPKLTCVSCSLTGQVSEGDSSLASNGLSLTDEGRLFFNSTAPFAATDTDERQDVYQWEEAGVGSCNEDSPAFAKASDACLALISAGTSSSGNGLLSANANGTDVYFFTRDALAPQDENGPVVKLYDAREGGGFPYLPSQVTCKASDECHGAASPLPFPIQAGSEAGTPHNFPRESSPCKKGFVKKHGKCVARHSRKHHHKRASHKRGGKR